MNFELQIDGDAIQRAGEEMFQSLRQPMQAAMAEKFYEITRNNFGMSGEDRPTEWPPLSERYAKKVDRDYATLFVSGDLEASINWSAANQEYSEVWSDSPLATVHQWGEGRCPARPFMPILKSGELTEYARLQVTDAALQILNQSSR